MPGVSCFQLADDLHAWAGTATGQIAQSIDAGKNWIIKTTLPNAQPITAIAFPTPAAGWVIDDTGSLFAIDGTTAKKTIFSDPQPRLTCMHFSSARHGWVAGYSGAILVTDDAGQTWSRQITAATDDLTSIRFASDARKGWAVCANGTILTTADGGATWAVPRYSRWPAPWYYFCWLILLGLFVPGLKKPPPILAKTTVIEGVGASDRPLEEGDADPLHFGETAAALSMFIRNENTPPPLTIAITGPWGSGKSSLMNLLKADLDRNHFRTVSFNAWHHQKEEHLLAALLENVRAQSLPRWWTRDGIEFRWSLLKLRLRRNWLTAIIWLAMLSFTAGLVAQNYHHVAEAMKRAGNLIASVSDQVSNTINGKKSVDEPKPPPASPSAGPSITPAGHRNSLDHPTVPTRVAPARAPTVQPAGAAVSLPAELRPPPATTSAAIITSAVPQTPRQESPEHSPTVGGAWILALLASAGGLLRVLYTSLTAFGVDPANLLATKRADSNKEDISAQTSFRYRFAKEFADVTEALNPKSMVVLIDDLDRCRPKNVLAVLEAVNFLVSSGDCYVVLGMDPDKVVPSIGLGFKDVASEMAERVKVAAGPPIDPTDVARVQRWDFAQQYLEKLVNIEVPVPRVRPEQALLLTGVPQEEVPPRHPWWQRPPRIVWDLLQRLVLSPVPWVLCLCALCFLVGRNYIQMPTDDSPVAVARPLDATAKAATGVTAATQTAVTPPDHLANPGTLWAGLDQRPSLLLLLVMAVPVALLAGWLLSIRSDIEVKDSPDFSAALAIWNPLIYAPRKTPRSVKRYMNRVRYFAMCQRTPDPPRSRWQRLRERLRELAGKRPPIDIQYKENRIPEAALVALSAVRHYHPDWLDDPAQWALVTTQTWSALSMDNEEIVMLTQAASAHAARFGHPFNDHLRNLFQQIYPSVRVHA